MGSKKYRLLSRERIVPDISNWTPGVARKLYRIQALRDIPEHGVKKGDIGGYVSSKYTLSQEGSCWIAFGAKAIGAVFISEDAYLGDSSVALCDFSKSSLNIKGSVQLLDNAEVYISGDGNKSSIGGNAKFFGSSRTYNLSEAKGNIRVYGDAMLHGPKSLLGDIEIYGNASLRAGSVIKGTTKIFDHAIIHTKAVVTDCIVHGKAQIGEGESVSNDSFEEEGIFINLKKKIPKIVIGEENKPVEVLDDTEKDIASPSSRKHKGKTEKILELFSQLKNDIASYETDIVKIIKYPVMTDRTDSYTMKMTRLIKKAERLADFPEDPDFAETVSELEEAFLAAESNALKIASTMFSDADRKKTEKAKDLLAIASNEGSAENEKKTAFKQAFKQLEGVVVVPEAAIDAFRIKIGLQELEM
jgi:carbonic anhydrase/acetyltransferase-like protein (isoleucine patch superfamily)